MTFRWTVPVDDVFEKTVVTGGHLNEGGQAELTSESVGWFIRFGNMSIGVGPEKPPFEKGDIVSLSMTKLGRYADG